MGLTAFLARFPHRLGFGPRQYLLGNNSALDKSNSRSLRDAYAKLPPTSRRGLDNVRLKMDPFENVIADKSDVDEGL